MIVFGNGAHVNWDFGVGHGMTSDLREWDLELKKFQAFKLACMRIHSCIDEGYSWGFPGFTGGTGFGMSRAGSIISARGVNDGSVSTEGELLDSSCDGCWKMILPNTVQSKDCQWVSQRHPWIDNFGQDHFPATITAWIQELTLCWDTSIIDTPCRIMDPALDIPNPVPPVNPRKPPRVTLINELCILMQASLKAWNFFNSRSHSLRSLVIPWPTPKSQLTWAPFPKTIMTL